MTVIFYLKSKYKTELSYQIDSEIMIEEVQKDINIMFKEKAVERITKTYIYLWNSGRKTINSSDIVKSEGLKIRLLDGEILSVGINKVIRKENSFNIEFDNYRRQESEITFEFIDAKDGAVIEIIHTSTMQPILNGTIMGMPKGLSNKGLIMDKDIDYIFWGIIFPIALISSGIFYNDLLEMELDYRYNIWRRIIPIALGLILLIVSGVLLIKRRKKYPKLLRLEKDNQE